MINTTKNRAIKLPNNLNRVVLSHGQMLQRIGNIENILKKERLAVCSYICYASDCSNCFPAPRCCQGTFLATRTPTDMVRTIGPSWHTRCPALHRIFKNAKLSGWSVEKLLTKICMAIEGTYHAKNFSKLEFDLATTIYELGGRAVLFALQKSPFSFPSHTTISECRQDFKLHITVGEVMMSDILVNIETMFKDVPADHQKVPITLSMDEVATDGRLCYLLETDEIARLCEHVALAVPSLKMGKDLTTIQTVTKAVCEDKIHVGKELLVAAFARNAETNYGAKPALLMPTCKKGSFQDSALIIEKCHQAWKLSPYGESLHGPLTSFASDGDLKRRPALYLHCMVCELMPADPLFKYLGSLPGLNLWTGSGGETQDLDYKHDMKRM